MYARASVKSRSSNFLSVQVKISSCSMPRFRKQKATRCKYVLPLHNWGTQRQEEATPIIPMWMQDVAPMYNRQLHMTFPSMREVDVVSCEEQPTNETGQWFTEPGLELEVQVWDIGGNNMLNENASRKGVRVSWFTRSSCQSQTRSD